MNYKIEYDRHKPGMYTILRTYSNSRMYDDWAEHYHLEEDAQLRLMHLMMGLHND